MLTTNRVKVISKLAFPFLIALSSTLLLALIDLAMVGSLGIITVAAVGMATFCETLVVAAVAGLVPAVQGIVARRIGEDSPEPRCLPLNAGLLAAVIIGAPLTFLCYVSAPLFMSLISSDPAVTAIAVPFLRILYFGMVAIGLNNAFEGHWAGVEKPKIYMTVILVVSGLNILLNYGLIFGNFGLPALGARGAAIGTTVALYCGVLLNSAIAFVILKKDGFLRAIPGRSLLTHIMKLGLPSTVQQFLFAAGYIAFFWMVGAVGTAELAAASVLMRTTMVMVLLAMALGMASATLVSRTVGEGDIEGAAQWGWDVGKLGVITITALGIPLLLFPELFLSFFLKDPHALSIAVVPLRMVALTSGMGSLIYIFGYTLYSVGDGNRVVLVSFCTQWIFFLPLVWLVGPYLHSGLLQIWLVQMAYGALATGLITAIWINGRWKRITI